MFLNPLCYKQILHVNLKTDIAILICLEMIKFNTIKIGVIFLNFAFLTAKIILVFFFWGGGVWFAFYY